MKWVMLVSGLLTCTLLYAAIAPDAALQRMFGVTLPGPMAELLVRNWGLLVFLLGAMLIYGAYRIELRPFILTVAGLSKVGFVVLALTLGRPFLGHQLGVAVVADLIQVALFLTYLLAAPRIARA